MKKSVFIFFIVSFLTQSSCTSRKSGMDKLWFYTYIKGAAESEDRSITPASFMNLQTDNSYTRDYNGFDYGIWEKNDSLLLLKSAKGATISFPVTFFSKNELRLVTAKGSIINFESQPGKFSSSAENPFSLENNQWRIPAAKKENNLEIMNRIKNHCKFYEVYFIWALDNKLNSIDVRSTPSLIKIYGNGFALKKFEELPTIWRSYFYDEEDCRKANDIVKRIFDQQDIAWAKTNSKYKMFISAFQQMQQFIK